MKAIELKKMSFSYPQQENLFTNLDFTIDEGESLAVIGRNGSGKTTLMKLITGILTGAVGERFISGMDYSKASIAEIAKSVSYVYQNPDNQIFNRTVFDEIAFGPKNLKYDRARIEHLVTQAIELCGLTGYEKVHPFDLPQATRKMITVASAIAMDTQICILDEPTAGQDKQGILNLERAINYLKSNGKTVLLISHDMEFVYHNFEEAIVFKGEGQFVKEKLETLFNDEAMVKNAKIEIPFLYTLKKEHHVGSPSKSIAHILTLIGGEADGSSIVQDG